MPDLDGFETARLIKSAERTRHIPLLFMTAISREEANIVRAYTEGAVDYLVKPFEPTILRAKVKVFVELHLKAQDLKRREQALLAQEQLHARSAAPRCVTGTANSSWR